MTRIFEKKHYVAIAEILDKTYDNIDPSYIDQWNSIRDEFITVLSIDSQKFDKTRFIKATEKNRKIS